MAASRPTAKSAINLSINKASLTPRTGACKHGTSSILAWAHPRFWPAVDRLSLTPWLQRGGDTLIKMMNRFSGFTHVPRAALAY